MVRRIHLLLALVALIGFATLPATAQSGRTFYIDYSSGSNSNPGTKTSPWKSHPYMQTGSGCTGSGSAPAYSHAAGDQFIFKGGVSWPAACFGMNIGAGGVSGNSDYYGVDTSWFTGGSFARPKFDLAGSVPNGGNVIKGTVGYVTWDNVEIANQGINNAYGADSAFQFYGSSCNLNGILIEHVFIHDWVTSQAFGSSLGPNYEAGSVFGCGVTLDSSTISDASGYAYNASGQKVAIGFGGACVNCSEVSNSTIHDTMAACFTVSSCHDSEFYNISQTVWDANAPAGFAPMGSNRPHTQVVEDDWGGLVGELVYNNYIHDNVNVGVTIYVNYCSLVYNNVLSNNANGNILITSSNGASIASGLTGDIENNTVDCSNGTACFATDSKATINGTVNVKNNQWITNGSPTSIVSSITTLNQSNNVTMSSSVAASQGYTAANEYEPSSSSGGTINAGVSLSALCSGGLAPLCSDRLGVPRQASWDAGAYEFTGQSQASSKPNPPTNLTASVQ